MSITLSLIVLIDRLLHLLRQRSELLDLTLLRLQWDSIRWQIGQETARIRADIQAIVEKQGGWASSLSDAFSPSHEASPEEDLLAASDTRTSLPTHIRYRLEGPGTQDQDHRSPDTSISSRRYHLPLLHSQIVNMEIRQRNLSTNLLSRSGKILDRMIDVAVPLKGLGGVSGSDDRNNANANRSLELGAEEGAVPNKLLDIQDDLEKGFADLSSQLAWCRALEELWTRYVRACVLIPPLAHS